MKVHRKNVKKGKCKLKRRVNLFGLNCLHLVLLLTTKISLEIIIISLHRFLSCHIPHLPRHLALLASLLRVVFLPLFLVCNLAPR